MEIYRNRFANGVVLLHLFGYFISCHVMKFMILESQLMVEYSSLSKGYHEPMMAIVFSSGC